MAGTGAGALGNKATWKHKLESSEASWEATQENPKEVWTAAAQENLPSTQTQEQTEKSNGN